MVTSSDCPAIAQAAISTRLDNASAQITFEAPCGRNWVRGVPESGLPIEYGFYQTVTFGVGNKLYYVLIRDGRAIRGATKEQSDQVVIWCP